ncbi:hypothetical protein M5689_024133 [Euphorbia peplus]|nr:hypothetical protein M5689_024133 [Euphorbia peplus]
MASSSNSSMNFPPKKLIVSTLSKKECVSELVECQQWQVRNDGETYFKPAMFHPEAPFMSCFKLPVTGEFPAYSLHMLWWLCYMHFIPFEFSLIEWCNSLSGGGIPELVQEFLQWFMPLHEWKNMFSRELWQNRRSNGIKPQFNSIIFLKWSESSPSYELFRTFPFSIVENWNMRPVEVDILQQFSANQNNYLEFTSGNRHNSNAPWNMLPDYYIKGVEESREIWELLQSNSPEWERQERDRRDYEQWMANEDFGPHMNDSPEI